MLTEIQYLVLYQKYTERIKIILHISLETIIINRIISCVVRSPQAANEGSFHMHNGWNQGEREFSKDILSSSDQAFKDHNYHYCNLT